MREEGRTTHHRRRRRRCWTAEAKVPAWLDKGQRRLHTQALALALSRSMYSIRLFNIGKKEKKALRGCLRQS